MRFRHAVAVALIALSACAVQPPGAAPATAEQKALAATIQATQLVDQAVLAATSAVRAGTLKGEAAERTLVGLKAARDGLSIADAAQQGAAK